MELRAALQASRPGSQKKRVFGAMEAPGHTGQESTEPEARAEPTERRWKKGSGVAWRTSSNSKKKQKIEPVVVLGAPTKSNEEVEARLARGRVIAAAEKAKKRASSLASSSRYIPPSQRAGILGGPGLKDDQSGAPQRKGRGTFSKGTTLTH